MVHKTSEIYKTLRVVQNKESKGFKIEDIVYAKEHQNDPNVCQELIRLSPYLLKTLEGFSLLSIDQLGFHLTEWGHSVLKRYEEGKEKYGSKCVDIIPANVEGKITFNVKINPKIGLKVKKEVQTSKVTYETPKYETPKEYRERKEKMIGFLSKLKDEHNFITTVKESENTLFIKTPIPYFHTIEERRKLDEIANELEMTVKSRDEGYIKEYDFTNEQATVTLRSIRGGKSFKTYQPLGVKVDLKQPTESVEKLLICLSEKLKR